MGTYYIRQSEHIQADLARGWSSWNFGQEGILAADADAFDAIAGGVTDEMPLFISGFEIYPEMKSTCEFGELYPGYWVLIDRTHGGGLSCSSFTAENDMAAIAAMDEALIDFGEGESLPEGAKLVYSKDDLHLFTEED